MIKNYIPTITLPSRLAIIAEGPASEDTVSGRPLSSNSYRILKTLLSRAGIPTEQIFLGYVSEKRSEGWSTQSLNSEAVEKGTARLKKDLAQFKPNCCLLLGDLALKVFGGTNTVFSDRGSLRLSNTFGVKYVSTYEPGAVMRNYSWSAAFTNDIIKAIEESKIPGYHPPKRTIESWPTYERLIYLLEETLREKPSIAFDLEGHPNQAGVTCYSIARSSSNCFIVPLRNKDNSPFWTLEQEMEVWRLTASILSDPDIKKTAQNAMYELFVFAWRHRILVRGLLDDTMFKMWELLCELPKDLGFIGSLFTKEPYYKDERTDPDLAVHHEYCCKDSIVTYEANETMDKSLVKHKPSLDHYRFNIRVLKPYLYMQLRGCKIDTELLGAKRRITWEKIVHQQTIVNEMSGQILNVKSSPQKAKFLYEELNLPTQYRMEKGQKKVTTNFDALCKLFVTSQLPVVLEICKLIQLRTRFSDLHKLETFADGRLRSNLNPVGTDTGRLSSSATWVEAIVKSPEIAFKVRQKNGVKSKFMELIYKEEVDNLGTNVQNVTKDLRDLFIPDREDFEFWQFDLSGADAWTVAADLQALGNSRMMDHLLAKIKPSIVIVLLIEYGNAVYTWDLAKLKEVHDAMLTQVKTVARFKEAYRGAKAAQHGCVTAGHEVLTRQGWIPIEHLQEGVEILTWDQGHSTWSIPSKLTQYNYSGWLHEFKGTAYDLEVTHDHRMPYQTNGSWKEVNASKMFDMKSGKLPVSGTTYDGVTLDSKEARLLAAFHSDGAIGSNGKLVFHFRRQRKIQRIMTLLIENEIGYSRYDNSDGTVIFEFNSEMLLTHGKKTTWKMLEFSSTTMRDYLEETLHWDGSVQTEYLHSRREITTAELERAEVLNTMARLCGFGSQLTLNARVSGFGSDMHSVSLNQRTLANRSSITATKQEISDVPVYCVTVPSSFFYVRRNSKVMVTGNTNYGMQPPLMAALQLVNTIKSWVSNFNEGIVDDIDFKQVHPIVMARFQKAYMEYYGLELRNDYLRKQLANHGYIDSANGHRRKFMSIRNRKAIDDATVRVAASHEPQANTTFATNTALCNMFYDLSNRTDKGNLRTEPLLMIHDALAGQNHLSQHQYMEDNIHNWFSVPLIIHGIEVNIPVEGGFGKNWKDTD